MLAIERAAMAQDSIFRSYRLESGILTAGRTQLPPRHRPDPNRPLPNEANPGDQPIETKPVSSPTAPSSDPQPAPSALSTQPTTRDGGTGVSLC